MDGILGQSTSRSPSSLAVAPTGGWEEDESENDPKMDTKNSIALP
jgi:hypothetical protein